MKHPPLRRSVLRTLSSSWFSNVYELLSHLCARRPPVKNKRFSRVRFRDLVALEHACASNCTHKHAPPPTHRIPRDTARILNVRLMEAAHYHVPPVNNCNNPRSPFSTSASRNSTLHLMPFAMSSENSRHPQHERNSRLPLPTSPLFSTSFSHQPSFASTRRS